MLPCRDEGIPSSGLSIQQGYPLQLPRYAGATQCQAAYETEPPPAMIRPMRGLCYVA